MLTVRDIMQTDVVTIPPEATVRELTRLLADSGISGVPVVTATGTVQGVVSSSDVVRLAAEEREVGTTSARWARVATSLRERDPEDEEDDWFSDYFLPEDAPTLDPTWGMGPEDGPMDQLTVSDIMTPVSFSVAGSATLVELAEFLVRGRIHRAVVITDGRLQGIVTTMDVLRALADNRI